MTEIIIKDCVEIHELLLYPKFKKDKISMAGRKPEPTAVKKLEGNPGKRKMNTKEPIHIYLKSKTKNVSVPNTDNLLRNITALM